MLHFSDQMDQFLGRGFTAGFLLHSFQDLQIKGFGKISKAVMEGDQLPAGELFQGLDCVAFQ